MSIEDLMNEEEGEIESPENVSLVPRGRGRPPGVKNGEGKPREPIKDWDIHHDRVVALYVGMVEISEIVEITGYSIQRIHQILNDPTGVQKINEAHSRVMEKLEAQIDDGLAELCVKALRNLRDTVDIEGLPLGSDFKKHQDKVSLALLEGKGHLSKHLKKEVKDKSPLDRAMTKELIEALQKSNDAADIVAGLQKDREIVIDEEAEVVNKIGDFTKVEK